MAKTPHKGRLSPQLPHLVDQYDEANVSLLNLISVQEWVDPEFDAWKVSVTLGEHEGSLSCQSSVAVGGVPHGMDGDFATALNQIFLEQMPEDGILHTTAYTLLHKAGFPDSSAYYDRLSSSLRRMSTARYEVSRAWRTPGRQRFDTVNFAYVLSYETSRRDEHHLGVGSTLSVRLADPIVASLRARQLRPLDYRFLISLKRPMSRALYRLLSAQRPLRDGQPASELRVRVSEWGQACKLRELIPARVRRSLAQAHLELVQRGYLSAVDTLGRGESSLLIYRYATHGSVTAQVIQKSTEPTDSEASPMDPGLLMLLRERGVALGSARILLSDLGEDAVRYGLARHSALLNGGFKPRSAGAFLVDVLRHPDKYSQDPPIPAPRTAPLPSAPAPIPLPQPEPDPAALEAAFRALPPGEQLAGALSRIRLLTRKRYREAWRGKIEAAVRSGQLEPWTLMQDAIRAAFEMRLEAFLERLEAM